MNWQERSDRELVELCLQGNQEAWREFVRRFQPLIAGVVSRTIRRYRQPDRSLVDDLVGETFLKLWKNECRAMRTFQWQHENSFRGFLKVVSSNVVQDYFRKSREEVELKEDVIRTENPMRSVERETLLRELVACLRKWTQDEPDCNRNLSMFLLFYRDGCTARQISGIYTVKLKAVENTLLRLVRITRQRCLKLGDKMI